MSPQPRNHPHELGASATVVDTTKPLKIRHGSLTMTRLDKVSSMCCIIYAALVRAPRGELQGEVCHGGAFGALEVHLRPFGARVICCDYSPQIDCSPIKISGSINGMISQGVN